LFCNCKEYNNSNPSIVKQYTNNFTAIINFVWYQFHPKTDDIDNSENLKSGDSKSNPQMNSNNSDLKSNESSSNSINQENCEVCGKRITGTWYTHLGKMVDCFATSNPKEGIGKWCSERCCTIARMKSCPSCYK